VLFGQGGNDVLRGGAGNDRLFGGAGTDAFVFDTALGANVDALPDFDPVQDVIHLDNAVFTALATGVLAPGQFRAGANLGAAQDADDRIVYDTTTGRLYYDADGVGGTAAIRFASLGSEGSIPTLTVADFLVT
jgi:Ca2+-binding RTX toxin-like protein